MISTHSDRLDRRRRLRTLRALPLLALITAGAMVLSTVVAPGTASAEEAGNRFLLRNTNNGGPANLDFRYGLPDDLPLAGDWNGNGTTTIGVRRGDRFLLRNRNTGGAANLDFRYGRADDIVLVGDWNGDGTTTVGVRRDDRFLLRNSNTGGPANLDFRFGRPGDIPIVGDFNGDGVTTVGVRRGDRFMLRNSNTGGPADRVFYFGRAGDVPLAGDFNGNGVTTVGVRRGDRFLLRNSNNGGPADRDFRYGREADVPLVGDFNGNGTTTIGVRRPPPPPPPAPEVVASFTTNMIPGQGRTTNIRRAAQLINGDVIAPGARYSLDNAIGDRTRARGFVPNGAISGGNLISTVGGGISQVGVTFLNAAWFSGIQIERFRPHSIYFTRYPMCREATLTRNVLDVVVRNDSPYPITVVAETTTSSITISFVSEPWAQVRSFTNAPTNVSGSAFSVSCGRTVTYPDGSQRTYRHSWRYSSGYPG